MNAPIKIGIVEDELIIAEKIKMLLLDLGYQVCEAVTNYTDALRMIVEERPDFLLLDVQLAGEKDGIDIAHYLRKHQPIPFVFLTANSDAITLERAKAVSPPAYIVKPFTKEDLYTSIEIVFANHNVHQPSTTDKLSAKNFIFLKDGYAFRKVAFEDIHYLESEGNYVNVFAGQHKIMVRTKLDDIAQQLSPQFLVRIHRSYIVNIHKIEGVLPMEVSLAVAKIPIGKTYKDELYALLGIPS